jgi:peptidoglycan glycosyltransferase
VNSSLRHVVIVLLGCFVLLFAQLNRIQVFQAGALRANPANNRLSQQDFDRPRAEIVTSDGVTVALSEAAGAGSPFDLQRAYPEGDLYAHTVGYISFTVGSDGVERSYNDEITGRTAAQELRDLTDLLNPTPEAGTINLTLDHELQQVAKEALGERQGSVVALDANTGAIRALWSWPSFDPNLVADNDSTAANAAYQDLLETDGNPLRPRSYRDREFPGSTFKIITAAAAIESGEVTLTEPVFEERESYEPPLTSRAITNFGGRSCGGDLVDLLVFSCNVQFSQLAAEVLGPEVMINQAQAAGFNSEPPLDLPGAVESVFPTDYGELIQPASESFPAGLFGNTPFLAQAAIGQHEVQATPLQMALLIAGVANDGEIPTPHVVSEVLDAEGQAITTNSPGGWRQALRPESASDIASALVEAATRGGASTAAMEGFEIGGKTGTAQIDTEADTARSHAWIVAFGGRPGEEPELAVAVLVEAQEGSDQTGGAVAGPIARAVFSEYFTDRSG